ncbi:Ger(x)C family spore germination protein [Solibacillus sp. MA9]|uniref:Ger(X)C family spore germination protein n=1 Tax=Solibacillus palustris TaxID=2908203 RepID=A0ABS9UF60_9BACL|nr:Ger(x)C family spore germination protein [Solibacillus sp. MA9]MCH7322984.1 Ger(x)C family spore germination protein [Solibacillus sp. MA9]
MKKLLFLPFLLLLAGCWDTTQPERMYYLFSLGIDFKDDEYIMYAQIIDFTNIAKSDQPNPEASQAEVGVARGRNFNEVFFNLYKILDERLFLGQLEYIVFSDEALKQEKGKAVVNAFIRYKELRYTTWTYVTDAPLEEILLTTPINNKAITLSKIADPTNSLTQSSFIQPINFRELLIDTDEPSHSAIIPFIELSDSWSTDKGPDSKYSIKSVALITYKDGYMGQLKGDDVKGLQWMNEKTTRGQVTIKIDGFSEPYITNIIESVKPTIRPIINEDSIHFELEVKCVVKAIESENQEKMDQVKDKIEEAIKKEIEATYKAALEMGVDVFRLSEVVYRKHNKAWKKFQADGTVPLNENSIRSIDVEVVKMNGERIISNEK